MKTTSPEELADIGFICKKMYEQLDDIRKEVNNLKDLAEKLACLKAISQDKTKVMGTMATATLDVTMSANLPHPQKNPEAYLALCEYLGVPQQMIDNDLFRLHWPGFSEFFTKLMAQGKPIPPGIETDKTHAHYKLKYRERK